MDEKKYYGILMNRSVISSGIYLFTPSSLVEGCIEGDQLFVDVITQQAYYMSSDGDSLIHDSIKSVAYIITEDDLLQKYGLDLGNSKVTYFDEINSKAHIGFYILDENKIQIIPYDFESVYKKLNDDESVLELDELLFTKISTTEDLVVLPVSDLEKLLKKNSFEEMRQELQNMYNQIRQLQDAPSSNQTLTIGSRKINSGNDIIQLFIECYDFLLDINNFEEMKSLLQKTCDAYENLYRKLDDIKVTSDEIEAAKDFLLVFIDSYDRMLKMDSLEMVKQEIKKIKSCQEERLLEVAVIYDEKYSKEIIKEEKTLLESKIDQTSNLSKEEQISILLEQLNSLIGLKNVKKIVEQLIVYLDYVNRTKEVQNLENPNLHMVFKGNPGTGKTTVARILAKLLYYLGYATKDKFLEITAQDLIAGYVGQTAIKTRKLLDENKGGVVFLDEAYIMCNQSDSFAEEALVEILKEMELKNTIFVFAGYQKEMTNFVEMNPGFKSRIGSIIDFDDYNLDELFQILCNKLSMHNLVLSEESKEMIKEIINRQRKKENFGNGRYINHLFDKIIMNHAQNCKGIEDIEELKIISVDDLKEVEEKTKEKTIGFKFREE